MIRELVLLVERLNLSGTQNMVGSHFPEMLALLSIVFGGSFLLFAWKHHAYFLGVTGFLVTPGDTAPGDTGAAADAVRRAAALSRRACRDHAVSDLDLERSLDAHEQLYQRLAGSPAPAPG